MIASSRGSDDKTLSSGPLRRAVGLPSVDELGLGDEFHSAYGDDIVGGLMTGRGEDDDEGETSGLAGCYEGYKFSCKARKNRWGEWCSSFTTSSGKLRRQRAEVEATRDVMLHGTVHAVARLLVQYESSTAMRITNPFLKQVLRHKVGFARKHIPAFHKISEAFGGRVGHDESGKPSRPLVSSQGRSHREPLLSSQEVSLLDIGTHPGQWDPTDTRAQKRRKELGGDIETALSKVDDLASMIDSYGRSSADTIIMMNCEIARLDDVISSKQGLNVKLIAAVCSGVYLLGQYEFVRLINNPADANDAAAPNSGAGGVNTAAEYFCQSETIGNTTLNTTQESCQPCQVSGGINLCNETATLYVEQSDCLSNCGRPVSKPISHDQDLVRTVVLSVGSTVLVLALLGICFVKCCKRNAYSGRRAYRDIWTGPVALVSSRE